MNESRHILTANYVSVTKTYYDLVVSPLCTEMVRMNTATEKYYRIAGKTICLKFYSSVLEQKIPQAFLHNEIVKPGSLDLTVYLWDSVETHTQFVSPWSDPRYFFEQKADTQTISTGGVRGVYLNGEETLTLYDSEKKTAYFWTHDATQLPFWVSAAPLRTLLHWFLSESNIHLVHGAVVGGERGAVLFSAKGGSGKSTTALACVFEGMKYLADDYVGIEISDAIVAHSLYNCIKVSPQRIQAFPSLRANEWASEGEKSIVFLSSVFPEQVIPSAPLLCIMIPVITHAKKTTIAPASKMQAMLALIPTTLFQLPLAAANKIESLQTIIARTPCYYLYLGEDTAEVAQVVKEFLS